MNFISKAVKAIAAPIAQNAAFLGLYAVGKCAQDRDLQILIESWKKELGAQQVATHANIGETGFITTVHPKWARELMLFLRPGGAVHNQFYAVGPLVALHELGHIACGHYNQALTAMVSGQPLSAAEIRAHEAEANAWAERQLKDAALWETYSIAFTLLEWANEVNYKNAPDSKLEQGWLKSVFVRWLSFVKPESIPGLDRSERCLKEKEVRALFHFAACAAEKPVKSWTAAEAARAILGAIKARRDCETEGFASNLRSEVAWEAFKKVCKI